MTIHVDTITSFKNGNVPLLGEETLRHHYGDYDLKRLKHICNESISKHNITVKFKHVKVHQDKPQNRKRTRTAT